MDALEALVSMGQILVFLGAGSMFLALTFIATRSKKFDALIMGLVWFGFSTSLSGVIMVIMAIVLKGAGVE